MNSKERYDLTTRNLAEVLTEDGLNKLIESKKAPVVYWGTAPTGKPHVGYFLPMLKVADLLNAGWQVKILLADLHAALDNTPWEVLEKRYQYYARVIPLMIKALGVKEVKNLKFVKGSDFQLEKKYFEDLMKLSSYTSVKNAEKAGSEVVKQSDNPRLSGLIYPLMQVLDEEYLKVDAQLGGMDQRKIFVLARESMSKLGYEPRIELINPLVPSLVSGGKMSASNEKSKIDLLDTEKEIKQKINDADCVAGDSDNGVMAFVKFVIMVIKQDANEKFVVQRPEKYGGNLEYKNYEEVEKDFNDKKLHPLDLKNSIANEIVELLKPIQKQRKELEKLAKAGYS
jgi:tyrosyl-tRNA synthetase